MTPAQYSVTLTLAGECGESNVRATEEATCELNINGDDMILQAVGDENALDRILQHAREQSQISHPCRCKCFTCIFAIVCLVCTLSDVGLTIYLNLKKPNVLIAEFHSSKFEGPFLLSQALLAVTFSTYATQMIIRGTQISTKVYFSCLAGFIFVIGVVSAWIFKEDTHGHDLKDTATALHLIRGRVERYLRYHTELPVWLNDFQSQSRCCGLEDFYDWKLLWRNPDVPDSCCVRQYEGCGKNFFSSRNSSGEVNVFLMGCLRSDSVLETQYFLLLEQIKFAEAFLFIYIALMWLCCWDRLITRPEQELRLRYTPATNNNYPPTTPARPSENDRGNGEVEPTFVSEQLQIRAVESRHSRRGAGDLGRKSEEILSPKPQDNYQSGDYTDIDPTKANHVQINAETYRH